MKSWINSLREGERDEFLGRGRHPPLDPEHDHEGNGYRRRKINFFVGHPGWMTRTGSDVQPLFLSGAEATLSEAGPSQRLPARVREKEREMFSKDLHGIF